MSHIAVAGNSCTVEPQTIESLFPEDSEQPSCKGCHVGSPELFVADPPQPQSLSSSSSTSSDLSDTYTLSQTEADSDLLHPPLSAEPLAGSEAHLAQHGSPVNDMLCVTSSNAAATNVPSGITVKQQSPSGSAGLGQVDQAVCVQQGIVCHRQAGLKVLVNLHGQGKSDPPFGSWGLDHEQRTSKQVCHKG